MPSRSNSPSSRSPRKNPKLFGFVFAWLEEREVCSRAIDLLLPTHRNGWLKPEVEAKLATLDLNHPVQADLHRRVTQALALLEAVESEAYQAPDDWPEMQPWLARALAYFVKNGDAIPDHFEDGFEDDHREFVEMGEKLGVMLDHFEGWWRKRKSR
ncbi:MAG: hypothetical protein JNK85_15445 [Verrucomicrobiales bacterium]|nr:hypothetical protein [Verrucomicrobiales bacterium]